MIELIPYPPHKRSTSDGAKKCPYCGRQFNMSYSLYKRTYRKARFDLLENVCKGCDKLFYFVNVDPAFVRETGINATYPREFVKGVR